MSRKHVYLLHLPNQSRYCKSNIRFLCLCACQCTVIDELFVAICAVKTDLHRMGTLLWRHPTRAKHLSRISMKQEAQELELKHKNTLFSFPRLPIYVQSMVLSHQIVRPAMVHWKTLAAMCATNTTGYTQSAVAATVVDSPSITTNRAAYQLGILLHKMRLWILIRWDIFSLEEHPYRSI